MSNDIYAHSLRGLWVVLARFRLSCWLFTPLFVHSCAPCFQEMTATLIQLLLSRARQKRLGWWNQRRPKKTAFKQVVMLLLLRRLFSSRGPGLVRNALIRSLVKSTYRKPTKCSRAKARSGYVWYVLVSCHLWDVGCCTCR